MRLAQIPGHDSYSQTGSLAHRFRLAPLIATVLIAVPRLASAAPVPAELPVPAADAKVAVIGSQDLTFADLPPQTSADLAQIQHHYEQQLQLLYLNAQRSQQALIETRVRELFEQRLTHKAADAEHLALEQIEARLVGPEPTAAAVKAFYEQYAADIGEPLEKAAPAIKARLSSEGNEHARRTALAELGRRYSAHIVLAPFRQRIEATGPSLGAAGARVTIVEFADFQCPYCRQMVPVLKRALVQYPHDLRLVYRYMPLTDIHRDALRAAEVGFCADRQGRFWEMHDAMFADQGALDAPGLQRTADNLKLDRGALATCISSPQTLDAIRADYAAATAAGVDGTPGLFVNGRYLNGSVSYEHLAALIDDELQLAGASSSPSSAKAPGPKEQRSAEPAAH